MQSTGGVDILTAIGQLWKLVAVIVIGVALWLFRQPINALLGRITRFSLKRGDTELAAEVGAVPEVGASPEERGLGKPEPEEAEKAPTLPPVGREPSKWFETTMTATLEGRHDDAEDAFGELKAAEQDPVQRLRWEAVYRVFRYERANDASALERLHVLSEHPEVRELALDLIGHAYWHSRDFEKARGYYCGAMEAASSEKDRAASAVSAARCDAELGQATEALEFLGEELARATTVEAKGVLYAGISRILESEDDKNAILRAIALEKAVEYNPSSTKERFIAAYAYGSTDLTELSALHYETLVRFDSSDAVALNNFAVECSTLGLEIKAVGLFRQSAEFGETLAMANLASRLREKGFAKESHVYLDKARALEDVHPNVGREIADLADAESREEERWKQAQETGIKHQTFTRQFADAYYVTATDSPQFGGYWKSADGEVIEVHQKKETVQAEWGKGKSKWKFRGVVHNRAATLQISKWQEPLLAGLLSHEGYYGADQTAFAYVSPCGDELLLLSPSKDHKLLLQLTRLSKLQAPPLKPIVVEGDKPA